MGTDGAKNEGTEFLLKSTDVDLLTLDGQVIHRKAKFVLAFFTLGIINHNGYIMVQSGASSLAKKFG